MSKIVGYTTGVFDLFHLGHLNILKNAREVCDELIVGVTTDELAFKLKNKHPIIPFDERIEILRSIRYVDQAVPQNEINEWGDWNRYKFDVILKGSDWEGSAKWNALQERFETVGVQVKFFPYTGSTSSTLIREILMTYK